MLAAVEAPGCLASAPEGSRQVWREPTGSELGEEEKRRSTGGAGDISLNPLQDGCGSRDTHQSPETTCAPGRTHGFADFTGALVSRAAGPSSPWPTDPENSARVCRSPPVLLPR